MVYDGYGRLESQHDPEHSFGTAITWTYNADDTVNKITDARGASQTFAYNNRHLPTTITYDAPFGSGLSIPAQVTLEYDGAGTAR
jgi:YD repeat-containing protein